MRDVSQEKFYLNLFLVSNLQVLFHYIHQQRLHSQMHYLNKSLLFPSAINQMHAVSMQLNLTVKNLDILLLNIFFLSVISILLYLSTPSTQKKLAVSTVLLVFVLVLKIMVLIQIMVEVKFLHCCLRQIFC